MERIDYILTDDFDLLIENGDFIKGDASERAMQLIAIGAPGFMRQFPEAGFDAARFRNARSSERPRFESQLREQLQADGFKVLNIDTSAPDWWHQFSVEAE
jgi:hypothetical protein